MKPLRIKRLQMGGYCFKIIACGSTNSESVETDDLDASSPQNKSYDKRGWSFRIRSSGHRVLSNSVITEVSSSVNKRSEPVIINSEAPISSSVLEKTSAKQWTEELPRVSTSATKGSTPSNLVIEAADEDVVKFNTSPDESSVIFIQVAVRKSLSRMIMDFALLGTTMLTLCALESPMPPLI